MYQAVVIACMVVNPQICTTFEGQQWFSTEALCKNRALKMAEDVHIYYKGYKPTSYKCRFLPGGALTK